MTTETESVNRQVQVIGGESAWVYARTVRHNALVCTMRVLWTDYMEWCGDECAIDSPSGFAEFIASLEGVRVREVPGRTGVAVDGLGLRPRAIR